MNISLRLGYGLKPNEDALTITSALTQLNSSTRQIGVRSRSGSPIEKWPEELTYTLEERVKEARLFRSTREQIRRNQNLNGEQKTTLLRRLRRESNLWHFDQLRFAHQAIFGDDPVRQRFMTFWWNHFSVGNTKGTSFYTGDLYWNVIGNGIKGTFTDLLYNVTKHPAMLTYLDNVYSVGENSDKGVRAKLNPDRKIRVGLNDNLARELLELHSVSTSANYTEADVKNTAKILSGWGWIFNGERVWKRLVQLGLTDLSEPFIDWHHEPGDKVVLGRTYSTSILSSGQENLRELIQDLAKNKHTIRHLSKKLCFHFINEDPSNEDIESIESAWQDSNGDLGTVHQVVIERAFKSNNQPKFQWPITWMFSILRTFNANIFPGWEELGEDPFFDAGGSRVYREIGQNFWSKRQPDGFSLNQEDWISSEHMDRRMRISNLASSYGSPSISSNEIISKFEMTQQTRKLVSKGRNETEKFTLLTCSPEFMGA